MRGDVKTRVSRRTMLLVLGIWTAVLGVAFVLLSAADGWFHLGFAANALFGIALFAWEYSGTLRRRQRRELADLKTRTQRWKVGLVVSSVATAVGVVGLAMLVLTNVAPSPGTLPASIATVFVLVVSFVSILRKRPVRDLRDVFD